MAESTNGVRPQPRILQLVHQLEYGGAELLAERFAHVFGGPSSTVIGCLDAEGPLAERLRGDGFRVECFNRRPRAIDFRCVRRLRSFLRSERIDLIHAHQTTPFFYSLLARGIFPSLPKIVFTEHGRFFPDRGSRKRAWLQSKLLKPNDAVIAVGEAVRLALASYEGLPWSRIQVIYNGIATGADGVATEETSSVRSEFGVPDGAFLVVQIARLDSIKNHGMALAAFAKLVAQTPHARLLIVGDGPERSAIEKQIAELELQPFVILAGSRNDVRRILHAADAALLTSLSEGIPLSLIEAMAVGLPVVSTSVGGVPEVVEQGVTGLLVPSGNADALATALAELASDPVLRRRMGQAGRERAPRLFDEQRMFAEYAAVMGVDPS